MRYGSVCSGIEAASCAWHPLGWRPSFVSEIEAFPRAVLQHRWPGIPLHGDFTTIRAGEYEPIDLLVGGTPCQSFSVAGLRGGLDDERGNLALEYLRLADRLRPRWLVWENVPGVLSSAGGRDFGSILGGLGELGYGFAYRVLDAQFFGVAQRRRRVFVVGHLGDWRRAAAVLFERHSLQGHPAPRREAREGAAVSPSLRARANSSHRADSQAYVPHVAGTLNANGKAAGSATQQDAEQGNLIAPPLTSNPYGDHESREGLLVAHSLRGEGFDASEDGTGHGTPLVAVAHVDVMPTMMAGANTEAGHNAQSGHSKDNYIVPVAYNITPSNSNKDYNARESDRAQAITSGGNRPSARGGDLVAQSFALRGREGGAMPEVGGDVSNALRTPGGGASVPMVAFDLAQITSKANRTRVGPELPASTLNAAGQMHVASSAVRRLTPRECERLQGFPDGYTDIPWRGKDHAPDGPRYKALGNSMAVPCMLWIGQRIQMVDDLCSTAKDVA